jgi:hypothetical protein
MCTFHPECIATSSRDCKRVEDKVRFLFITNAGYMKLNVLQQGLLIFVIGLLLSLTCFSQTKDVKLATKHKSEIIKAVLDQFVEDYSDEFETDEIILSSLNINTFTLPLKNRAKVTLLSPDEINAKVVRDGFVDYFVFSEFNIKGSKAFVKLEGLHTINSDFGIQPLFGHGFYWEGKRKSGRWAFECVNTSSFSNNLTITGESR